MYTCMYVQYSTVFFCSRGFTPLTRMSIFFLCVLFLHRKEYTYDTQNNFYVFFYLENRNRGPSFHFVFRLFVSFFRMVVFFIVWSCWCASLFWRFQVVGFKCRTASVFLRSRSSLFLLAEYKYCHQSVFKSCEWLVDWGRGSSCTCSSIVRRAT